MFWRVSFESRGLEPSHPKLENSQMHLLKVRVHRRGRPLGLRIAAMHSGVFAWVSSSVFLFDSCVLAEDAQVQVAGSVQPKDLEIVIPSPMVSKFVYHAYP